MVYCVWVGRSAILAMQARTSGRSWNGNGNGAQIGMQCCIRIKGHLDPSWQEWFEGLEIVHEPAGTSRLSGSLKDQAALYGVLAKLRGLGLAVLALQTSDVSLAEESGDRSQLLYPGEGRGQRDQAGSRRLPPLKAKGVR